MARLTQLISILAISSFVSTSVLPRETPDDENDTPLPLVIWHGLGDDFQSDGMKQVASIATEVNEGTYTYSIHVEDDASSDRSATFFGNLTLQIDKVCADLASDPIISTAPAIDAIGFSQGGQFLRGYIERCNKPPVRSLLTFGSQHNGISEFQACQPNEWLCKGAQGLLRSNTWSSFVQSRLIPAQYFRDPLQMANYLESSNFLADVNNERKVKNQRYKENLSKLERFVMYLFEDDETVIPKESSWFADVNGTVVTPLRERDIYKEDWIGLRALDEKGALKFESTPGGHMQLTEKLLRKAFKDNFGPYGRKFNDKATDFGLIGFQQEL